jgi:hypothetical protein
VARVTGRRRGDLAAIAAAMTNEDRNLAIRGLTAFADAAGELPLGDPFGWSAASPPAEAASDG